MHHFRGKLFQGDKLVLDPANVYIDYHASEADAVSGWAGYLVVASENDVVAGGNYTLKLVDGRAGRLRINTSEPNDSGKFRATFVGEGSLG